MKLRAEIVLQEAHRLQEEERAEVAGALLENLDTTEDSAIEAEWRREVAARVATLETGEVGMTPWVHIRGRLLARLSERRQA